MLPLIRRHSPAVIILGLVLSSILVAAQAVDGESNSDGSANNSTNSETGNEKGNDDTEFAFNLFSDIAPILALFGEQFATQFASESMTWLDHLVFAAVPLGILTAITGAIRVQGPKIARSFIGRARENRALAEIELMSSTSDEVCELFNGKAIVRAMGKPKMAQFVIFPDKYSELEDKENDPDKSCGIYTLQAAISTEGGTRPAIMEYRHYHSRSYRILSRWWKKAMVRISKSPASLSKRKDDEESAREQATPKWLGPPNLQLNLSSDHSSRQQKTVELFVAAVIAIVLQLGLLVIAAFTVFHEPTKARLRYEPLSYGFASYVIGSVLLFVGMATCSLAIEQSTTEFSWIRKSETKPKTERPEKLSLGESEESTGLIAGTDSIDEWETRPRLVWLQACQSVNDQSFESYVILAGAKRYVVTSSRFEDARASHKAQRLDSEDEFGRRGSTGSLRKPYVSRQDSKILEESTSNATWETLTIFGVFSAGVGFVLQFVGLRGLSWPCSVAQLLAIFVMAMIRAIIRRRLGRIPVSCTAPADHELDFLAINITFCAEFREFRQPTDDNKHLSSLSPHGICQWKVVTAAPRSPDKFYFRTRKGPRAQIAGRARKSGETQLRFSIEVPPSVGPAEVDVKQPTTAEASPGLRSRTSVDSGSVASYFDSATSQQLLRVRERLGNMCEWEGRSFESSLALAQSIELFMAAFCQKLARKRFEWVVDACKPSSDSTLESEADTFVLTLEKTNDKWEADLGKIDAVLSLWLANIEARKMAEANESKTADDTPSERREASDWRRAKAGTGSKYTFCRIIGDDFDDRVLSRDVSWWVDELIADQSAEQDAFELGSAARWDRTVKLVIGFNGRPASVDKRRAGEYTSRELAVVSSGHLPAILAQHIFTSFMWAIADQLPRDCLQQGAPSNEQEVEIEGSDEFDPYDFSQSFHDVKSGTWYRPTLRHRQLTKVVREMEVAGLGSFNDILLCMIPALSFTDRLPNEAMLRLMPRVGHGKGWIETARCYRSLLHTSVGIEKDEHFAYDVAAATMDFLYLAYEPYDEFMRPEVEELRYTLDAIVRKLDCEYSTVLQRLMPLYEIQRRAKTFRNIFKWVGGNQPEWIQEKEALLDTDFAVSKLGFTPGHLRVVSMLEKEGGENKGNKAHTPLDKHSFGKDGVDATTPDIFGLTPLHYACYASFYEVFEPVLEAASGRPFYKTLDDIRRSPVHYAARLGKMEHIDGLLGPLSEEDRKFAVNMPGLDGMTALHLAAVAGDKDGVKKFLKMMDPLCEFDIWGRGPLHIAVRLEHEDITSELLKAGARPEQVDKRGKTALSYIRKDEKTLSDKQLQIGSELMTFWKDYEARDERGWTPLHYAAEFGDEQAVKRFCDHDEGVAIEAEDFMGRTALHAAIMGNRVDNSMLLLNMKANPRARDKEGVTAFMFSCQREQVELGGHILGLIDDPNPKQPLEERDNDGRTALHHAVEFKSAATVKAVLGFGADIEAEDEAGLRPLHAAIFSRSLDIVRLLIEMNADVMATDTAQRTTLMIACMVDHVDIAKLILEVAPEITDKQDENGRTALHYAVDSSADVVTAVLDSIGDIINIQDKKLRTALHQAIYSNQDENAVCLLKAGAQPNTVDDERSSPLTTACRDGCIGAVEHIIAIMPDLVNEQDAGYGQTPLAWACEYERIDAAKALLSCDTVDPNIAATGYWFQVPLHFAVAARNPGLVDLLLAHPKIDLLAEDCRGVTPVVRALVSDEREIATKLMSEKCISDDVRVQSLKQFCSLAVGDVFDLFPDFLASIPDDALTGDDLVELMRRSSVRASSLTAFLACLYRAMERPGWKMLKLLLNMAARSGFIPAVKMLMEKGVDPTQRDEDGWSCVDYAVSYGHEDVGEVVERYLHLRPKPPHFRGYEMPRDLVKGDKHGGICLDRCECDPQSQQCNGMTIIRVETSDPSKQRACLRSQHAIPRDASFWYFEIQISKPSESKNLAIGFGDELVDIYQMPGWSNGSWAFHGDDGRMFIEDPWNGDKPSDDFGLEAAAYGDRVGVIVGVGLDMRTGKGFCTLDGRRLDMGDVFDDYRFNVGKMYPCVGVDVEEAGVGLEVKVVLRESATHPFVYRGPYECE